MLPTLSTRLTRACAGLALVVFTTACGAGGGDEPGKASRAVVQGADTPSPASLPAGSASVPGAPEAGASATTVPSGVPVVTAAAPAARKGRAPGTPGAQPDPASPGELTAIDQDLAQIDSQLTDADLDGASQEGDF